MCVCVFKIFIAESKHLYLKIETIQFRQILRAYVLALADTGHYFFFALNVQQCVPHVWSVLLHLLNKTIYMNGVESFCHVR